MEENLDEFGLPIDLDLEPDGCERCNSKGYDSVVVENFSYEMSALGPFTVPSARLLRCPECEKTCFLASEARGWERAKAKEVVQQSTFTGKEAKFLRGALRKTYKELSADLGVSADVIRNWEEQGTSEPLRSFVLKNLTEI